MFLLDVIAGPRRGEVLGFHWRDVDLAEPTGAVLRVRETWVCSAKETPKSEAGERTIPLGPWLAEELWQHRRRTGFSGDDERVFCSPTKGTPFDVVRYATTLRAVLGRVGIEGRVRPFHDLRHTAITNDAASGNSPAFAPLVAYLTLTSRREPSATPSPSRGFGTKIRYKILVGAVTT